MRRFGEARMAGGGAGRNRQQRLAVLDSAVVDARRRLVLIRRDNVEHLLLIGGPTDVVVEPNIVRATPAGGAARPGARPGGYETEEETAAPSAAEPEAERTSVAAPMPRAAPPAGSQEPPRTMPRPAPQRIDPQYADMAQRLEAALRKPGVELDAPRPAPAPQAVPAPRAPEPRAEPRILGPAPARAPAPRAEPRVVEAPRPASAQTAQAAPPQQAAAADAFSSLEEEMASLLRPGAKKESK
jgi:hypothetical protein